ncbi:recombinase RecT [Rhizobium sp. BK251]|uniref:recombinase RecT n=1 Tax=Rhizobium sp. BK251 TaxID=2512125 RepID=UPI0010439ACE|nr:recombinase RecT [Rhizobium sp. BK251]TCL70607.1 phage RecT family recombinase [Rhizobium sp. BK251]
MNQIARTDDNKQLSPSQQFRVELDKMADQFAAALPSHIKPEKFQRVVMTAVVSDPDILKADRKSLMESAIRAAQDGLLPDKREGAFVVFNTKVKDNGKDVWVKAVQWMPMVGGIIKRVHQSGDIKMLTARVVYGGDHFRTWIDDTGEHIEYEPAEDQDQNVVRRVFAMATTTDGAVYVEPLSAKDVEKIRNVSKQKDRGPWADWWEEMAKKSAIRRLAKRLPLSVDIHDLLQRDNGMYELTQDQDARPTLADRLKAAKNITPDDKVAPGREEGFDASFVHSETASALTGEILTDNETPESDAPPPASETDGDVPASPSDEESTGSPLSSLTPVDSNLSDDDRTTLVAFCNRVIDLKRVPDLEARELDWRDMLPAEVWPKLESLSLAARAVINGKRTRAAAISFMAEVLGVEQSEIGGAA